jgi:hypothetical protein
MAIEFYDDIVLHGGLVPEKLSVPPSNPVEGFTYYNSVDKNFYQWNGTLWTDLSEVLTSSEILTLIELVDGSGSGLDSDLIDGKDSTYFAPQSSTYTKTEVDTSLDLKQNRKKNITSVNSNYTILPTDDLIVVDTTGGDVTITLIDATTSVGGNLEIKKKVSSNKVNIVPYGSQTIEGKTSWVIKSAGVSMGITSDGTNYIFT